MSATTNSGQTPLSEHHKNDLLIKISSQEELNYCEALNIDEALQYYTNKRVVKLDLGDISTLTKIHKHMFKNVWKWAGNIRQRVTNFGAPPKMIREQLKQVSDNYLFWQNNQTYNIDEIAIRYHYHLVVVHPFENGNGRFSRLVADFVAIQHGRQPYSWGRKNLAEIGKTRDTYLDTLRKANNGVFAPLISFALN